MSDRERLGQTIINICAGERAETALAAQIEVAQ